MSCYGPDQEAVTGCMPTFDTGDKLALPAPCILLTVLGFSVEFMVHLIGPEHMCIGSLLNNNLLPGTKVTGPRTSSSLFC